MLLKVPLSVSAARAQHMTVGRNWRQNFEHDCFQMDAPSLKHESACVRCGVKKHPFENRVN